MNSTAIFKGKKFYFGIVVLLLAIIFLISNGNSNVLNVSKHWLDSSILGSKVFTLGKLFELLGGLGLFLFGIKFMGEGLQLSAGDQIKQYITKFTDNPIKGFILGLIITGLIQSSSGTTALVVALVSVGLMSFRQSMAVIVGSNLGTTITSILIGLKIKRYVWIIIAIGGLQYMFANKKKARYIAQTVLGFGILFLGMNYMGGAMKPLAKELWFKDLLIQMDKGTWYSTWLGLITSVLLTVLVQSSSASIGIIQTLHGDALITGTAAIPMIFGANIGTTITALLASFGASLYAKRTAAFHIIFNVIGAIIFTAILPLFKLLVLFFVNGNLQSAGLIPVSHVTFNITMALIFLPLIPFMEKLIKKIIKREINDDHSEMLKGLNYELVEKSPVLAADGAQKAIASLTFLLNKQTDAVYKLFKHGDKKYIILIDDISLATEQYTEKVIEYLDLISSRKSLDDFQKELTNLTLITRDISRINQINIILKDVAINVKESKILFSEEAYNEIKVMFKLVHKIGISLYTLLNEGFRTRVHHSILEKEDQINKFDKKFKKNNVKRIKNREATQSDKKYFAEIMTRVERLADHQKMSAELLNPEAEANENIDLELINELISIED